MSEKKILLKKKLQQSQQKLDIAVEALELILKDDDKPSCVNDDDCPLNGGDGFDNHCNENCPYIIARVALTKIKEE